MPYGHMNLVELARFLGVDQRRAQRMAQRGEIPCRKVGGQLRFNRAEVTEWLQQRMGSLEGSHLARMDAGITAHREINAEESIVTPLLRPKAIDMALPARTSSSLLKELVALAQETELVYDGESLLEALDQRERLCSTAMEGGIAIPHPRRPLPYAIAEPVLAIAHTPHGIGFGGPDGRLSYLFFMTCSQDDRQHLHVLARLCRMLHDNDFVNDLRQTTATEDIVELMRNRESAVLANMA